MKCTMKFDYSSFEKSITALFERIGRSTRKATLAACEDLLQKSLAQVPRKSGTLASSGFIEITGSSGAFTGTVGYARSGPAAQYAIIVHEDLEAYHTNGKAKFLEDPVREYVTEYSRRAALVINEELQSR